MNAAILWDIEQCEQTFRTNVSPPYVNTTVYCFTLNLLPTFRTSHPLGLSQMTCAGMNMSALLHSFQLVILMLFNDV
jgi:hypothetical protein